MPKLWTDTIEAHRREVRDAILDTTAALVDERGLLAVTMSQIAEATGIGRATLYKYFPDVESILFAWHQDQISRHLEQLEEVAELPGRARDRLEAVLEAFALITRDARGRHGSALGSFFHGDEQVDRAEHRVQRLVGDLVAEAAADGDVRDDLAHGELASYCINALGAARELPSKAAVRRLVRLTLEGLRPSQ
ncbi:MAG TPA: TetR/AcrR family transcriptional regulator [Actinomycetota bacterium]|nr:TetR/AcrR family transcriptional regulator [Actinomycetota bacterium]